MFSFVVDYISVRSGLLVYTAPTPHRQVGAENSLPQATRVGTNRGTL